ncbi:MAG: hypothetical protein Q9208_007103 [Pyrenodesmia sp. 3 TL-2023]
MPATLETISVSPTQSLSLSAIGSPTSLTEAASPTGSLLDPSFQPIDECSRLGNIEYFPQGTDMRPLKFRIQCKTDRSAHSPLRVHVYTFEDCVNACASYNYNEPLHQNHTCAGVTYGIARTRKIGGNCFFLNDLGGDTKADDEDVATIRTFNPRNGVENRVQMAFTDSVFGNRVNFIIYPLAGEVSFAVEEQPEPFGQARV